MLEAATSDGSNKRQSGLKPPWHEDSSHEAAIYSHLARWKRGELQDPHSGSHPLVHTAWRCLAIAATEAGNVPSGERRTGKLIYIASPYTIGDVAENVHVQIEAAHRILDMGHYPIVPLLSHFLHLHRQRKYQDWIELDLAIIPTCDVLFRLPGESRGADNEVKHAHAHGVVVYRGWQELDAALAEEMREAYKEPKTSIEAASMGVIADWPLRTRTFNPNEQDHALRIAEVHPDGRAKRVQVRVNGEWKDL